MHIILVLRNAKLSTKDFVEVLSKENVYVDCILCMEEVRCIFHLCSIDAGRAGLAECDRRKAAYEGSTGQRIFRLGAAASSAAG